MKPLMLKITGLNSFIEEQKIDFSKLTEHGLFGIFGPTGSGKSTILDAITIAMYGKIPRNTSEFVNTSCDSTEISYEFEIGKGNERKKYIVDRVIKRDAKTGGYTTRLARLREVIGDDETILADRTTEVNDNIVSILGLTVDDFTRSVVLPQGQFNNFLKLKGVDRRNMLERIFNLERYGNALIKRIRNEKNIKSKDKSNLEGQLKRYQDVSLEKFNEIKEELKILKVQEENLRLEKKKFDLKHEEAKNIYDKQIELKGFVDKRSELDSKVDEINSIKVKAERGNRALVVRPYIDEINKTEETLNDIREKQDKLNDDLRLAEEAFKRIEEQHRISLEVKEKQVPVLIEKEAKLKQGIDILAGVNKLKGELKDLQVEFEGLDEQNKVMSDELDIVVNNHGETNSKIDVTKETINSLKVEPELRKSVQRLYELERDYKKTLKEEQNCEDKINNLICDIDGMDEEYKKLKSDIDTNNNEINSLKEREKGLKDEPIKGNDWIIERNNQIGGLRNNINKLKELLAKKEKALIELGQIIDSKVLNEEKLKKEEENLNRAKDELAKVEKELEEYNIKNLSGILAAKVSDGEACPVCGSVHHPNLAVAMDNDIKEELEANVSNLKSELSKAEAVVSGLKANVLKFTSLEEVKTNEVKGITDDINSIKDFDGELDENQISLLEDRLKFYSEELQEANFKKEKNEAELCEVTNKLNVLREVAADLSRDEARLQAELNKDKETLNKLLDDKKNLEAKESEEGKAFTELRDQLKIDDPKGKLDEINANDERIIELEKELKKLETLRGDLETNRKELEDSLSNLKVKKAEVANSLIVKGTLLEEQNTILFNISEGRDVAQYLASVGNEIERINNEEKKLKDELEETKENKQGLLNQKSALDQNFKTHESLLNGQQERLIAVLNENGFDSSEEVLFFNIPKEEIKLYENKVDEYKKECLRVEENIRRIEKELDGKKVEEEEWNSIKDKVREIEVLLSHVVRDIGAKGQRLNEMEKSLGEVKELENELKKLIFVLNQLEELDRLVQGNKFVEFVAMSQLKYIAAEASRKLKDITRGRYALELDMQGNFVMRDDFSGGSRRSTDTLSGGETFLTSLSLALALSSQIQLKGSAPLEFFFLDEGFGTLDSELLEVVMGSLERLRRDRLSVGIISHVDELKNRVPIKLNVIPAKAIGEGTRVQIEYS